MARTTGRDRAWSYVELLAAAGFAIAQPLLAVFGRAADEFIYRQAAPWQIVAFTLAVCLAVPTVVWLVEQLIGLVSAPAARWWHVAMLAVFAALFSAILAHRIGDPSPVVVWIVAILVGVGFGAVYLRVTLVRTWLRVAALGVPAFAALFLLSSSVTPLVLDRAVAVAAPSGRSADSSVVLLVFDEWPTSSFVDADGEIDETLFPNLAALARTGTWYRNATSVTNSTWHAVPTIFTGQEPKSDGIPEAYSHPESIFTLLQPSHRMEVSETVTRVCPHSLCAVPQRGRVSEVAGILGRAAGVYRTMLEGGQSGVTSGFEEDAVEEAVHSAKDTRSFAKGEPFDLAGGMASGNQPARFDGFIDGIRRGESPTLHVLHMLLPHVPYGYLPDGLRYPERYPDLGAVGDQRVGDAWPAQLANERLLLQAAYVDHLVGRMMERLRTTGLLDRSVVVVTADHGIAFDPGAPVRGLEDTPIPPAGLVENMWRPLFVKLPGQTTGGASDANVLDLDIVPTIARALDITIPWKVDGVPAGSRPAAQTDKPFAKSTVNPFGAEVEPTQTVDGRAGLRSMLARNLDVIAPAVGDPDPLRLYRVGPRGALVGRPLTDFTVAGRSGARLSVDDAAAFANIDLRTGTVPALVTGALDRKGTVVAVVNGVVAGTSPTFRDGDEPQRFALMVPTRLMRQGPNELAFYVLDPDADRTLHPLDSGG
jgi:hypothetical protein